MASDVQICNMALSHVGSDARVSSINPPDGSVEAGHCATFFAQCRLELLELGNWNFSLARAPLAPVPNLSTVWSYAYALPATYLRALRVLSKGTGLTVFNLDTANYTPDEGESAPYEIEGGVLYTHEPDAVLVYVTDVVDTAKFTPSFTSTFSYLLAGYIAGPIVRGNEGAKLGDSMRQRAASLAASSATVAANASSTKNEFVASQLRARA